MSIRARLVAIVAVLAALGLAVAGWVTHAALQRFLLNRFDQQLYASITPAINEFNGIRSKNTEDTSRAVAPKGAVAKVIDAEGAVQRSAVRLSSGTFSIPTIRVDRTLSESESIRRYTTSVPEEKVPFRVQLSWVLTDRGDNYILVIAAPLDDLQTTLRRLVTIELLVAAGVLGAIIVLGYGAISVGLRPLGRIEDTAEAITTGHLSERIETEGMPTELGSVVGALNTMLGRIETSFAEKEQSELRLRRFVADASHELRTPLTSIRAYAELFRRGAADDPEDLATVMRRIEDESARMGGLVEDLLLLARLDNDEKPLERGPVDLSRIAADAVADARAVEPDRPVALEAAPSAMVNGDEARLRQVAANLVANVRTHTPAGTPFTVRAFVEGSTGVLEVADQGPGLDPIAAAKVFERFYRTDESRSRDTGGAGLGLSIVAAIAKAHGGNAVVLPTPGGGATFRVEVPALTNAAPAPWPPPAPASRITSPEPVDAPDLPDYASR